MTAAKLRRAAIKELARRARANRLRPPAVKVHEVCHAKQAKLVDALVIGPARNICALAGRQSGKSHGAGALAPMLCVLATPGVNAIVVTATDASCEKMAFLPAVELNRIHGLGGNATFAAGDRSITFPNGSVVWYLGANNQRTIDRLRGTPNLVLCVIDEAGIYDPATLDTMIKAVRPGLRPRRGKLCVMGTPSPAGKQGTWYDITQNDQYDQHRFDYRDNDRVPDFSTVEATIDEDLKAQFPHMTPAEARLTAWFLREYLALFEVDLAEKVYQLTNDNLVDDIPTCEVHVTGGDIGMKANDALVCLGWTKAPDVYVTDQEEASGQDTLEYARMVQAHDKRRHPFTIAVDPGGLGQKTIKTVKNMHPGMPITEAVKGPIGLQVRAVNEMLQGAHGWRLKLKRGSKLALELASPTWVDGKVGGEIDEHGRHSDLTPSLRYACIAARPYLAEIPPELSEEEEKRAKYLARVKKTEDNVKRRRATDHTYDVAEFDTDLYDDME